jgi:hypothetical protein
MVQLDSNQLRVKDFWTDNPVLGEILQRSAIREWPHWAKLEFHQTIEMVRLMYLASCNISLPSHHVDRLVCHDILHGRPQSWGTSNSLVCVLATGTTIEFEQKYDMIDVNILARKRIHHPKWTRSWSRASTLQPECEIRRRHHIAIQRR